MTTPAGTETLLQLCARAKVNLALHVTGRRADGFHELNSLIVFAGVGDELEIAPAAGLSLDVDGPFAAALAATQGAESIEGATTPVSENLILRAARALSARYGVSAGARLRLIKHLPVAAGIGGGSADAAAALQGLAALWSLDPGEAGLAELAAGLGADVPVCLAGRPSIIAGIGERISPAPPLPPAWLVLVNPGVALSTAVVFDALDGSFSQPMPSLGPGTSITEFAAWLTDCRNDLQPAARELAPEIDGVLAYLDATTGCLLARMSGSGATCFGLFASEETATAAAVAIATDQPAWWVRAAPMLGEGSV